MPRTPARTPRHQHLITIIADAMISSRLSAQARRVCEVMMARERDPFYACLAGSLGMT
jgi:hypothetical protein